MNKITLHLRRFPVRIYDSRDEIGVERDAAVTVTKDQLQAAQIVGQSSKELVERFCDRQGWTAITIGKPVKLAVTLDLDELWTKYSEHQDERAKWDYLYGAGQGGEADAY